MIKAVLCDMDGVIYRGSKLIDGAKEFVRFLQALAIKLVFISNISERSPQDLCKKLNSMGIDGIDASNFMTAALATAQFIKRQSPHAAVWVLGGDGLRSALRDAGMQILDMAAQQADYVVVGMSHDFDFKQLAKAAELISKGARFIGTNPDQADPTEFGSQPACGALLAAIATGSGKKPYIVGKPNPLMLSLATRGIQVHSEQALMIGDRMDTDIAAGMAAAMHTCLVLTGVTKKDELKQWAYKPDLVCDDLASDQLRHYLLNKHPQ